MPAFTGRSIDPGATPSAPVAVKVKGGVEFQGVIPVRGTSATDEYDSGRQAIPAALTQVTASTVYIDKMIFTNRTQQVQYVTVQNTAGLTLLDAYPLPPSQTEVKDLGGAESVGVHWHAGGNANSVNGQITGWQ